MGYLYEFLPGSVRILRIRDDAAAKTNIAIEENSALAGCDPKHGFGEVNFYRIGTLSDQGCRHRIRLISDFNFNLNGFNRRASADPVDLVSEETAAAERSARANDKGIISMVFSQDEQWLRRTNA